MNTQFKISNNNLVKPEILELIGTVSVTTNGIQTLTNKTITTTTNDVRATRLSTTSTDVVISGASVPTTGQILGATSPTTAEWGGVNATNAIYSSGVSRTVSIKLGDHVSVLDYGADDTGVTDTTVEIQAALDASLNVYFPEGTYKIEGNLFPRNFQNMVGAGMRSTILDIATTAPGTAIIFNGNSSIQMSDMRLSNGTTDTPTGNAVSFGNDITPAASVNNRFTRVWFGPLLLGVRILYQGYWSTFTDCIFRECATALIGNPKVGIAQTSNAITFTGCTFFRDSLYNTGPLIDIEESDGITFNGCQIQNSGFRLKDCVNITLIGGYYEAFVGPNPLNMVLELENTSINMFGPFISPGSQFKLDLESVELMTGFFGPFAFGTSTTPLIGTTNDSTNVLIPIAGRIENLFPDYTCSTNTAISSTVATTSTQNAIVPNSGASASIVSGEVEIILSSSGENATYTIPLVNSQLGVSVMTKFRCITGVCNVRITNATPGQVIEVDSSTTTDTVLYCNSPIVVDPLLSTSVRWGTTSSATIRIERLIVSQGRQLLTNENSIVETIGFIKASIQDPTTFLKTGVVIAASPTETTVFTLPYDGVFRVVIYEEGNDFLLNTQPYTIFELIVTTATASGGLPTGFTINETDIESSVFSPSNLTVTQGSRRVQIANSGGAITATVKITTISAIF